MRSIIKHIRADNLVKPICFIKNPIHLGQKNIGTDISAEILSNAFPHINSYNSFHSHKIDKFTDFEELKKELLYDCKKIYKTNLQLQNKYDLLLNLGGDHSMSIGSVTASLEKYKDELKVIWIDAHADLNTIESSKSKNFHGMPVNFLMNIEKNLPEWITQHQLHPEQILYIGLRDLDPYEIDIIKYYGIDYITMDLIREHGLNTWLECVDNYPFSKVHLSLDIDGIDPVFCPSTGTPVTDGLNIEHIITIINHYHSKMVSMDLVEFNPLIGKEEDIVKTFNICREIIENTIMLSTIYQ
jgi:arginase